MCVIVLKNGTIMESTSVYVPVEDMNRVRELGLNKTEIFRNALKTAISNFEIRGELCKE